MSLIGDSESSSGLDEAGPIATTDTDSVAGTDEAPLLSLQAADTGVGSTTAPTVVTTDAGSGIGVDSESLISLQNADSNAAVLETATEALKATGARYRSFVGPTVSSLNDSGGLLLSQWTTTGSVVTSNGYGLFPATVMYQAVTGWGSALIQTFSFDVYLFNNGGVVRVTFNASDTGVGYAAQFLTGGDLNGLAVSTSFSSVVADPTKAALTAFTTHHVVLAFTPSMVTMTVDNVLFDTLTFPTAVNPANRNIGLYASNYAILNNLVVSGHAVPTTLFAAATAARTRSGHASPTFQGSLTASSTRSRSGYALPSVQVPAGAGIGASTGTAGAVVRWRLDDPVTRESYVFEINPNAGGSPTRTRQTTKTPTTASDGSPLIFQGQEDVWAPTLKGSLRTKEHYRALLAWYNKRYTLLLTDDLGRVQQVVIEKLSVQRAQKVQAVYRQTYDVTFRVLAYGTGPALATSAVLA